jgi:hypothetical protein
MRAGMGRVEVGKVVVVRDERRINFNATEHAS